MRFSIILSACEVAPFIQEAVRSVRTQDFTDFELIIMYEKSRDATRNLLVSEIEGDSRCKLVDLPRSGSASAGRNRGIHDASGDYLVFLDGDDFLESGCLRRFDVLAAENGNPEIITGEYRTWIDGRTSFPGRAHKAPGRILPGMEALSEFLSDGSYRSATWRNLYRRDFLAGTGLLQIVGRRHQDDAWTPWVFCAASRVFVSGVMHYNYRKRPESVTTDHDVRSVTDIACNIADALDRLAAGHLIPSLQRRMTQWQYRAAARFYSPLWRRLYPRELRQKALCDALRGRFRKQLDLFPFACLRDRGFALVRWMLPWSAAEALYRFFYREWR